jgi:spore maturation protein CgeB
MPQIWGKKILAVHMQWDYCDPARGPGPEKKWFYDNLKRLAPASEVFFYDEFINDLPLLRRKLLEKAEAFNPDLIFFVPYTSQFSVESLDLLKSKWPTCAWFGDDTWRFDSYSSKLAPHFTHVLTTDAFTMEKYRAIGVKPILTQWAAEPIALVNPPAQVKYKYDVSFVGAYKHVRGWFVKMLAAKGIDVECFGYGWPNGKVSSEEMGAIFNSSRINLNLSNSTTHDLRWALSGPLNLARYIRSRKPSEQIKARNFEIPLAGGFQLTNYVPTLERYLKIGEEVSTFTTPEDCAGQIRYYLANDQERAAIATAGYERAMKEHTYLVRLSDILSKIWPQKD